MAEQGKTVRFAKVVANVGKPEPVTLWTEPERDPDFQKALKQHRVMTVHQENVGARADFGTVGYTGDKHSGLLIFPKSLKAFEGAKVIGIKYDQVETPAVPAKERAAPASKRQKIGLRTKRVHAPVDAADTVEEPVNTAAVAQKSAAPVHEPKNGRTVAKAHTKEITAKAGKPVSASREKSTPETFNCEVTGTATVHLTIEVAAASVAEAEELALAEAARKHADAGSKVGWEWSVTGISRKRKS